MKQRIKITAGGIFGNDGEIPVGTEFTVSPPLPEGWSGKYEVIGEAAPGAEPVTNTDEFTREGIAAMDKADVLDLLEMHGWDGDKRLGVDKLRAELIAIMFVDL